MTNEELLQQAKAQALSEMNAREDVYYQSFEHLLAYAKRNIVQQTTNRAIELAIQRAREEAWIDVDDNNLPAKGEEILMLCPKENGKCFYHCVGFYSRWREHEADVDDDDVPGIDYDVEAGIAWITEGFYEEEEQHPGEYDTHYVQRYPVKWRKLTAPGR